MHRRLLPSAVLVVAAALACAGCTTAAPGPAPTRAVATPSSSAAPSSVATPSSVAAPLDVPGRLPGEIARDAVTPGRHVGVADDVPKGVTRIAVHVACSGPAGSGMRWAVRDGDARPFGPSGDWTCAQGEGEMQDDSGTAMPALLQVSVDPDPGVTVAWAVVTDADRG